MPDLNNNEVCTSAIGDNAVQMSKIQDLFPNVVLGRLATSQGDPQQIIISNDFYCDSLNYKLWVNRYDPFNNKIDFFEDCFGNASVDGSTHSQFLSTNISGTGATINSINVAENGIFGVWSMETGTTTTGRSALFSGRGNVGAAILLGQGPVKIKTKIKIPTLSTSGERYKIIFGLIGDCSTSTVNDGAYFEYSEASSTQWRLCAANDGVRSEPASAVTVAAATWIRLEIIINAAGNLVNYVLNGSTIGTNTTNIPSGTGDPVSPVLGIWKSAGSTNRTLQTDYVGFSNELTSMRAT